MSKRTLTVRGKLTLAFGGLAAVIVLVSGLAVKSLADANVRFADFVNGTRHVARIMEGFAGLA